MIVDVHQLIVNKIADNSKLILKVFPWVWTYNRMAIFGNLPWQKRKEKFSFTFSSFLIFRTNCCFLVVSTKSELRCVIDTAKYQVHYFYSILHIMFSMKLEARIWES